MKLPVYNLNGEKIKELVVPIGIFGRKVKIELVHQAVVAQQANARQVLAHTKTKGEVRGGGRKPWRQKGTGRARHGSIRSPLWRGGGVTFGPTKERNFSKKINQKQKQLALFMCLSDKVSQNSFLIFEPLTIEQSKTKILDQWLKEIKKTIKPIKASKKFLLVTDKKEPALIRAAANLPSVKVILADSLNCLSLLEAEVVCVSPAAVEIIAKHYKKINLNKEKAKKD